MILVVLVLSGKIDTTFSSKEFVTRWHSTKELCLPWTSHLQQISDLRFLIVRRVYLHCQ